MLIGETYIFTCHLLVSMNVYDLCCSVDMHLRSSECFLWSDREEANGQTKGEMGENRMAERKGEQENRMRRTTEVSML